MPKWEHMAFAKIHEGCGGYVRWVEAIDRIGVGYTGECLACGREGIPTEEIIPIRSDPGASGYELVEDIEKESLAALEWDETDEWNHNQKRLRKEIGKP